MVVVLTSQQPKPADMSDMSDSARAAEILSTIPFIQKLEEQDEGIISRLSRVAKFKWQCEGSVIFRQGDPGKSCYILLSGEVEVLIWQLGKSRGSPTPRGKFEPDKFPTLAENKESQAKAADDIQTSDHTVQFMRNRCLEGNSTFGPNSCFGDHIGPIYPGSLFGELALMNHEPRKGTVRCALDSELLVIEKDDYNELRGDMVVASEAQVIDDCCRVLAEYSGSVVKAWRRVLDPSRAGELIFQEFMEAMKIVQFQGCTSSLWVALMRRARANNRDAVVSLRELAPRDDKAIEQFKQWMKKTFGGAIDMFDHMSGNLPNAFLRVDDFVYASRPYGDDNHLDLVLELLDPDDTGVISIRDLAYMETDGLKRKATLDPHFMRALDEAKLQGQSFRRRNRYVKAQKAAALEGFHKRLKIMCSGSFIRSFRTILDRFGKLALTKVDVLKGCQQISFQGDVMSLWKAMDRDGGGFVEIQEIDVRMGLALGSFREWATTLHGSCPNAVKFLQESNRRRTPKWGAEDFIAALNDSDWPGVPDIPRKQAAAMIHEAADLSGMKYVAPDDFRFIDTWEPMRWLCAEPDFEGREELMEILKSRYSAPIVAWRWLLDKGNKNHVSYPDFEEACQRLQLKNAPGIWRALDVAHDNFISLRNFDPESAQILWSFKKWCEETFGSIDFAFKVLASPPNPCGNSLSLPIFKRALADYGYPGDAKMLFQRLKPDATGREIRIKLNDLKYLSTWEALGAKEFDDNAEDEASADQETQSKDGRASPIRTGSGPPSRCVSKDNDPNRPIPSHMRPFSGFSLSSNRTADSDFRVFCRVPKEHEHFEKVLADHVEKQVPVPWSFEMNAPLKVSKRAPMHLQSKFPASPYTMPVVKKSMGPRSTSLPTLTNKSSVLTNHAGVPRSLGGDGTFSSQRLPNL